MQNEGLAESILQQPVLAVPADDTVAGSPSDVSMQDLAQVRAGDQVQVGLRL